MLKFSLNGDLIDSVIRQNKTLLLYVTGLAATP